MRVLFLFVFSSMLSASICQNVTLGLYNAAADYAQKIKIFAEIFPEVTDMSSRPDTLKAEEVLSIIKSMQAKCNNTIEHQDPAFSNAKKALQMVLVNDLCLQKSGPFAEPGLIKAREEAITASNKLMALLVEIPRPLSFAASNTEEDDEEDEEEENEEDREDEDEEEGEVENGKDTEKDDKEAKPEAVKSEEKNKEAPTRVTKEDDNKK